MYKYRNHQKVSLSAPVEISTCKVQSNLVPPLRSILQRAQMGFAVSSFPIFDSDVIPPQYSKMSFTELAQRLEVLTAWYKDNEESLKKIEEGDYSEFEPKPAEPAPPTSSDS